MAQYTQGEMKASKTTLKSSNFADHVAHISIGPKVIGRINGGPTEERDVALANAARLALCWNMHDRLIERLRNLCGRAEDWEIISDGKHFVLADSEAYQNARALLSDLDGAK